MLGKVEITPAAQIGTVAGVHFGRRGARRLCYDLAKSLIARARRHSSTTNKVLSKSGNAMLAPSPSLREPDRIFRSMRNPNGELDEA